MIDITIQSLREVQIEGKTYDPQMLDELPVMIEDIIDRARYSGESITLWKPDERDGTMKVLVREW